MMDRPNSRKLKPRVQYATNTPYSVFSTDGRYYCCQEGIWYDSGFAQGPWDVCAEVPSEIYLIPPSCPHYYCTYCHVYGATPDVVYAGYYPGYRGCFVSGPTVVYGTGWHYPCWAGSEWYPRPVTWGVGAQYDAYSGNWTCSLGLGGPVSWMGLHHSSEWGGHAVSAGIGGWWGGVGYRHSQIDVHHNLQFRDHVAGNTVHNVYARHSERLAPIHTRLPERVRPLPPERRRPNNVYSDRQGNAYRRPPEGGWERRTRAGWERDAPQASQVMPRLQPHHVELERRNQTRTWGQERTRAFYQNSGSRPTRGVSRRRR